MHMRFIIGDVHDQRNTRPKRLRFKRITKMATLHAEAEINKAVFIRLSPGTDLLTGIACVCQERGIRAGSIASCIASLRRASFFVVVPMDNKTGGGYSDPRHLTEPVEIVSGQGSIGEEENGAPFVHLHAALADSRGHAHGGHLIPGTCPILITSEIVILPLAGLRLVRTFDADAGMPVLKPTAME
jgi:predicted DNA-binding protein with PD1-like motif